MANTIIILCVTDRTPFQPEVLVPIYTNGGCFPPEIVPGRLSGAQEAFLPYQRHQAQHHVTEAQLCFTSLVFQCSLFPLTIVALSCVLAAPAAAG